MEPIKAELYSCMYAEPRRHISNPKTKNDSLLAIFQARSHIFDANCQGCIRNSLTQQLTAKCRTNVL